MNNARLSKRKRQAILFFTYGFMTLATIVISTICILLVLGYRFDIKDQRLEQGALVQFRSTPAGATVILDGETQRFTTPGKLEVSAGQHTVTYRRDKYLEWSKTVTVDAGELRWLNYARLVPTQITTKQVAAASGVTEAQATPDRKYMAALAASKPGVVVIYDLRDVTKVAVKTYTLPETVLSSPELPATYRIVEWDFGSRFLLLLRTTASGSEYIRLDRTTDSGSPVNVTKEFNLPFNDPHFSGTSGNVFYALTGTDLRRVDLGNKSVTSPLVSGVVSYRLYRENDIAFVAVRADKKVAGVYVDNKETIARSYAPSDTVTVDLTEYFSHRYIAVAHAQRVEIIKDPTQLSAASAGRNYAALDAPFVPTTLDFASSGRFVTALSGRAYVLYDLETDEQYTVNAADSSAELLPPRWIDDYYLVDNAGDQARLYEFDGGNKHSITKAQPTLPMILNDNGRFLISFGLAGDTIIVQASQMIVD